MKRLTIVGFLLFLASWALAAASAADPAPVGGTAPPDSARLAFTAEGGEYRFDTGLLRGTLRPAGRSLGLAPLVDGPSGSTISGAFGCFSHYRLLDDRARYGGGAWDWPSRSRLAAGGAVEATWSADKEHPFQMTARYRWKAANVLDLTTRVTARRDLRRLEVFLASYFRGFPVSLVYVKGCPESGGRAALVPVVLSHGAWQMFPRDAEALKTIGDGRWTRPPNPVPWAIRPALAAPLAVRRDAATGLAALVMAPAEDCFAVATPYGEEGHRSLYLSLFGRDLRYGETATARARLVIGRGISDAQAIALYRAYSQETRSAP
jgi:hypothetical protein